MFRSDEGLTGSSRASLDLPLPLSYTTRTPERGDAATTLAVAAALKANYSRDRNICPHQSFDNMASCNVGSFEDHYKFDLFMNENVFCGPTFIPLLVLKWLEGDAGPRGL